MPCIAPTVKLGRSLKHQNRCPRTPSADRSAKSSIPAAYNQDIELLLKFDCGLVGLADSLRVQAALLSWSAA
jgi:hypothetical protein